MPSWTSSLRQSISRTKEHNIAVVGIGQELGSDDAAGILVVRQLTATSEQRLIVEGGLAPENALGLLRRFQPALVILVDAAFMDEVPGAIRLLDWRASDGVSASTHSLPLSLFCSYLTQETGCEIILIGIQAADTGFGQPPSSRVKVAARAVANTLITCLHLESTKIE